MDDEGKVSVAFSSDEMELIRWLASQYTEGVGCTSAASIQERCKGDEDLAIKSINRLVNFGFLRPDEHGFSYDIVGQQALSAIEQYDNPSPVDHWSNAEKWFRSRSWSVLVILLFVGLPLLVQWVQMIEFLLDWILQGK